MGRVRIIPASDVAIDVFVTHTAADPDPSNNYNNEFYRQKQVEELIENFLNKSSADVTILGGDFNAGPDSKEGEFEFQELSTKTKFSIVYQWYA